MKTTNPTYIVQNVTEVGLKCPYCSEKMIRTFDTDIGEHWRDYIIVCSSCNTCFKITT